jgi:hypothetical protein
MERVTGEAEIEYICEGGFGDEAHITVQLRKEYPGIGGTILTYQSIAVALRTEYVRSPQLGHKMFYKHAIIKKLEDFFFKTGVYGYAHVTRPLGSVEDSYIYEWAFGVDSFPWEYIESGGERTCVQLDEWDRFVTAFNAAGIDMLLDCADPEDGRISKNIVHQLAIPHIHQPELNRIWKRVDFGDRSIKFDYPKLFRYLADNEAALRSILKTGRFEFLELACKYLAPEGTIGERELGMLEQLTLDYRMSTLSHLNTRGVERSPEVCLRHR